MATILTLAEEAQKHLVTGTRDDGDRYIYFDNTAPKWTSDLAFAAHDDGEIFPDDWRYRFIESAIDAIVDNDGDEDQARETAEQPDTYTSDLTAWLHSRGSRAYYLTEVLQDFGSDLDGFQLLSWAQQKERSEVFSQVWQFLADMEEEELTEED